MNIQKKYLYAIAIVSIIGIANVILWKMAKTGREGKVGNEIERWVNGSLRPGHWVEYDKLPFVENDPLQTREGLKFWVYKSNSTCIMVFESQETTSGPWGLPASEIKDFLVYNTTKDWLIYPFTVYVPKAEDILKENNKGEVLKNEKGWDTLHFKFKMQENDVAIIHEWILDEDTHIAEKIKVTRKYPDRPTTSFIMELKKSSFFVGDELLFLVTTLGHSSLIVGPIIGVTLLYRTDSISIEEEKKRIQSVKYRKQYIKSYEETRK